MKGNIKDYTGQTFNSLTCIERIRDKEKKVTYYICKCECGNITKVRSDSLVRGNKTCGKCPTKFINMGNYLIGKSNREFIISTEDYHLVKDYNWSVSNRGYVKTTVNGKSIYLHRLIMGFPHEVDHINRDKSDNRRSNLRVVTRSMNVFNRDLVSDNKSGKTGVYYDKSRNKWAAQITKDGVTHSLGRFESKEYAIKVRMEKELELFGEYSPCSI